MLILALRGLEHLFLQLPAVSTPSFLSTWFLHASSMMAETFLPGLTGMRTRGRSIPRSLYFSSLSPTLSYSALVVPVEQLYDKLYLLAIADGGDAEKLPDVDDADAPYLKEVLEHLEALLP